MFQRILKATLTFVVLTLAAMATAVPIPTTPASASSAAAVSSPDFSLSVSPATESRKRGTGAVYDLTIQSLDGFSGTVQITTSGAPPATTGDGTFPVSISAGQSVTLGLVFQTHKVTTPIGTFTLTFTGTSGNLTHTVHAILQTR
jgi:hypothetical protein